MKPYPAIALLEFRDIAVGIYTTDAMVKKAPIAVLKSGTISDGRFAVLVGGSTGSVEESCYEGLQVGGESVLDHLFLPDVHPAVHEGILGRRERTKDPHGAMGVVETTTIAAAIRAADRALKATPIGLVELRLTDSWLAGKGVAILHGDLHDVQSSVEIAVEALEAEGAPVVHRILTKPHEAVTQQVEEGTHFVSSTLLDLEGETPDVSRAPAFTPKPARKKTAKKKVSKSTSRSRSRSKSKKKGRKKR